MDLGEVFVSEGMPILAWYKVSNVAIALREEISAQHVGNAIYGLRCLGDSQEALQLVAALAPKVELCREDMNAQEVRTGLNSGIESNTDE